MTEQIHLVVATPCFGGQVSTLYVNSIFAFSARYARYRTCGSRLSSATAMR